MWCSRSHSQGTSAAAASWKWNFMILVWLSMAAPITTFGYMMMTNPQSISSSSSSGRRLSIMSAMPPPGGIDTTTTTTTTTAEMKGMVAPEKRGKVNEIDFCMAPSDASLSRSYGTTSNNNNNNNNDNNDQQLPRKQSLTRALNSVSNRALRRILLSRSWPSAEALNLSLRQVLSSSSTTTTTTTSSTSAAESTNTDKDAVVEDVNVDDSSSNLKCPVPRPILNIIMNRRGDGNDDDEELASSSSETSSSSSTTTGPKPTTRTDEQWVNRQIEAFRESYGQLDGYEFADAYLESILSLATSGEESHRVTEVLAGGVYDDSYRRFCSVIKSVGAVFETIPDTNPPRLRIASKLMDQDICLSMLDKLAIENEKKFGTKRVKSKTKSENNNNNKITQETDTKNTKDNNNNTTTTTEEEETIELTFIDDEEDKQKKKDVKGLKKFMFWAKEKEPKEDENTIKITNATVITENSTEPVNKDEDSDLRKQIENMKPEDLGGVLLSAEEPTMTRQLNVLSNIVKRALLFGGDEELLVLYETLEADKSTFVQKWYPGTLNEIDLSDPAKEYRPGVQYFNCLVKLLKNCYVNGGVTTLDPPYPLNISYQNSYERLTALLVELGSGYLKPVNTKKILSALPKTPTEEFGRFAQWEVNIRQTSPDTYAYPDDLVGSWQVRDEISGKTIGKSTVILKPDGEVSVDPPLKGLRWRLDPGPTHLDTCTFQVLSEDGAILQYKGFVDRGARLEARFSKRSIKIRGGVSIQMRDGEILSSSVNGDMLPLTAQTGTTRFVMKKVFDLDS